MAQIGNVPQSTFLNTTSLSIVFFLLLICLMNLIRPLKRKAWIVCIDEVRSVRNLVPAAFVRVNLIRVEFFRVLRVNFLQIKSCTNVSSTFRPCLILYPELRNIQGVSSVPVDLKVLSQNCFLKIFKFCSRYIFLKG